MLDSTRPLWQRFAVFLVPLMAANILQALSGTINSIYVGQLIGVEALAVGFGAGDEFPGGVRGQAALRGPRGVGELGHDLVEKRGVADLVGFLDEGLDVGFEFAGETSGARGGSEGGAAVERGGGGHGHERSEAERTGEGGEGFVGEGVGVGADEERRGKEAAGGDA